jgi:Tol biopolymer transport system component
MNRNDAFDRSVSAWLEEEAGLNAPNYLDEILGRTSRTRQRPAWSSLERWLPMSSIRMLSSIRPATGRRLAWLAVVLLAIVALTGVAVFIGSQHRLPPPFGPARNGALVYGLPDGDIYALDVATGQATAVITGTSIDAHPLVTPDGSRILFDRVSSGPLAHTLMVADVDGTDVRPLMPAVANVDAIAWSPDGSKVSMSSDDGGVGALRIVSLDGTVVEAVVQRDGSKIEALEETQWRPNSREVVFHAWSNTTSTFAWYAIQSDGTGLRTIFSKASAAEDLVQGVLSPDGTSLAGVVAGAIHVVNAITGADRPLAIDQRGGTAVSPAWSPDGKRLAFERWDATGFQVAVVAADGGAIVQTGPQLQSEHAVLAFSPDGLTVLVTGLSDNSTWLLDPSGGPGRRLALAPSAAISWQRLAP